MVEDKTARLLIFLLNIQLQRISSLASKLPGYFLSFLARCATCATFTFQPILCISVNQPAACKWLLAINRLHVVDTDNSDWLHLTTDNRLAYLYFHFQTFTTCCAQVSLTGSLEYEQVTIYCIFKKNAQPHEKLGHFCCHLLCNKWPHAANV